LDQNKRNDSDEESELSEDDHNNRSNNYTFVSAIDVGSHFIDVNPSEELKFSDLDGNYFS
jgi:hypothetical protein